MAFFRASLADINIVGSSKEVYPPQFMTILRQGSANDKQTSVNVKVRHYVKPG